MKTTTKTSHWASITRKWPKNSLIAASILLALVTLLSFKEQKLCLTTVFMHSFVFTLFQYTEKISNMSSKYCFIRIH